MIVIDSFDDIRDDFLQAVAKAVCCNFATVDTRGRPRSCVMHPIWEGSTAWILTGRSSLKALHLQHNPHVSLAYIAEPFHPVYIDAIAEWVDDAAEKARIWGLYKTAPEPYGFDPAAFFGSVEKEWTGLLKIKPRRIDLHHPGSQSNRVWNA